MEGQEEYVKLAYKDKASVNAMREILRSVLSEHLTGQRYDSTQTSELTKTCANLIRERLKAMERPQYKFMVQVVIGERREQGVRMGCRCFWDGSTDSYASENYMNDSLFAVATAYAVYLY